MREQFKASLKIIFNKGLYENESGAEHFLWKLEKDTQVAKNILGRNALTTVLPHNISMFEAKLATVNPSFLLSLVQSWILNQSPFQSFLALEIFLWKVLLVP